MKCKHCGCVCGLSFGQYIEVWLTFILVTGACVLMMPFLPMIIGIDYAKKRYEEFERDAE